MASFIFKLVFYGLNVVMTTLFIFSDHFSVICPGFVMPEGF